MTGWGRVPEGSYSTPCRSGFPSSSSNKTAPPTGSAAPCRLPLKGGVIQGPGAGFCAFGGRGGPFAGRAPLGDEGLVGRLEGAWGRVRRRRKTGRKEGHQDRSGGSFLDSSWIQKATSPPEAVIRPLSGRLLHDALFGHGDLPVAPTCLCVACDHEGREPARYGPSARTSARHHQMLHPSRRFHLTRSRRARGNDCSTTAKT